MRDLESPAGLAPSTAAAQALPTRRDCEPERPIGPSRAPEQQRNAADSQHEVGEPDRQPTWHQLAFGHLAPAVLDYVVDEHHGDAGHEGRQLAAAPVLHPQPEPDHRQHDAGKGQRELAVQRHRRAVHRQPLRAQLDRPSFELGDRHLVVALEDVGGAKHGVGVQAQDQLGKARDLVFGRVRQRRRMARASGEDHVDRALVAIDRQPAGLGSEHGRLVGFGRVGQETLAPAAAGRGIADVEDAVGEVLEEDARLDLVLRARGDDAEDDLAKRLIGRRDGLNHDVRSRRPRHHRE